MIYFPILSVAPEYFDACRGSAMGLFLSGTGVGGLIFSPSFQALLREFGPRWALRFLAFLNWVISLPIALTAAPSRFLHGRPTHVDLMTARKPATSVGAAFLSTGDKFGQQNTLISSHVQSYLNSCILVILTLGTPEWGERPLFSVYRVLWNRYFQPWSSRSSAWRGAPGISICSPALYLSLQERRVSSRQFVASDFAGL